MQAVNVTLQPQPAYPPPTTPLPRLPRRAGAAEPEDPDMLTAPLRSVTPDVAAPAPRGDPDNMTVSLLATAVAWLLILLACMCCVAIRERMLRRRSEAAGAKGSPADAGDGALPGEAQAGGGHSDVYSASGLKGPFSVGGHEGKTWKSEQQFSTDVRRNLHV